MSSRRREKRLKTLGFVGLGVLTLATFGAVGSVSLAPEPAPPISDQVALYYSSPPVVSPPPQRPVMAIVGDSFASTGSDDWPARTARCASYRAAISGARSSGFVNPGVSAPYGAPERMNAVTTEIPEVVIFETASNDARGAETRPERVQQAAIDAINSYRHLAPNAKYVILGPFPTDRVVGGPNIANNVAALSAAAAATGATHIVPSLEWQPTTAYTKTDLAHPNEKGHRYLTSKLLVALHGSGIIDSMGGCENML